MAKARARTKRDEPRRLPRGRHALAPEEVREDQRRRLIAAVPHVAAEHGYEAMSVADIVKAAAVSRNAFYNNFKDKEECFAAAHEAAHERLLAVLEQPCDRGASVEERVETSLGAALDLLAAEPDLARLLFVEAPAAGEEIALRYHEWLRRYGVLLRSAIPEAPAKSSLAAEIDQVIVGGIATRLASEVLQGRAAQLRILTPHLVEYILAFYGSGQPDPQAVKVVALEPEAPPEYSEARRKQAGA
ncbi:MAG TPA: TetR/AcrR family transcriptional regulator [Solirubrobacterales bacterium]|jgi:AcrR family transcriptional regulator|nr:TetR/AcrR family transcriptional regulator [Solirubrobacterales bacterium]